MNQEQSIALAHNIKNWAKELGLSACAITDTDLGEHETHLLNWLKDGFHGEMHYMQRHGTKRSRPVELAPGTVRIISVRLDYYPPVAADADAVLEKSNLGYVSRYALGRDYHKVLRKRLQLLADKIKANTGDFAYRAFTDSAPILEKAIAEKAGLGWIGKHSNLLGDKTGSWFFLGELFTDLPLPIDPPQATSHCGSCTACIDACPTNAIVAPYRVDARRCISYLTIELDGSIPVEFRRAMGNRIYGCDDCQLVCPFNKFSSSTEVTDFKPRYDLDAPDLCELFAWSEQEFDERMQGSPIRRIGYWNWLRNIAIALGNAVGNDTILGALNSRRDTTNTTLKETVAWALLEQQERLDTAS